MYVSSQATRNWLEQSPGPRHDSLEPGGHDVRMSRAGGLGYTVDGFAWSFSPGPSLDVLSSREIINSLFFTRRTYATCLIRHV